MPETGKQRAARIPLDYYKGADGLERGKLWLGAGALLLSVVWLASGLLQSDQGRGRYSRGPVAFVHATWENNCTACHVPFVPIGGDTWASALATDPHASNGRCATCHAGPAHHENQVPNLACAACHRDHRGRDASLTRLPDSDCVQCHGDLAGHTVKGKTTFAKVTRFAADDHPELRGRAKDPGTITFSHKVHMSPGMATEKKGDPSFKLLRIPEAYRDRYRQQQPKDQQKNSDLVQLQCSSCHQLDAGDFGIKGGLGELPAVALLPARAKGAYMLPIAYENQCQACHPLTFERTIKDKPLSGEIAVRHRIQGDEVHQYLTGHYTAKALDEKFQAFEKFIPVRPKPGKLLGEEAEPVRKAIRNKVRSAEQLLFSANTCGKCHTYETSKKGAAPRIKPAAIKDVWLENARFSHKAHRAADCRACHARAYPDSKDASDLSSDVMIPGIDTCLQCHAPPTQAGGKLRGGARFDCTECHRYHNGDHSREGVGAGRRAPRKPRDVDRLLLNLGDE